MCCCGKPTVNGQPGYRWNDPNGPTGIHPVNPPNLADGDVLIHDEPGRCGGQDSHSYHYRVVRRHGSLFLLVRHGGGDEIIRLSNPVAVVVALASVVSIDRYWILNAIYHAHSDAARNAKESEAQRWRTAAVQKRIKTRKQRGSEAVKVWIEPARTSSSKAQSYLGT